MIDACFSWSKGCIENTVGSLHSLATRELILCLLILSGVGAGGSCAAQYTLAGMGLDYIPRRMEG